MVGWSPRVGTQQYWLMLLVPYRSLLIGTYIWPLLRLSTALEYLLVLQGSDRRSCNLRSS
ncbi:hypothetical protein BJY01DRAFT_216111 [Aspergillus pseudoustus]|uniref:Uncharacterized protein n=1 Tax=Aspergillus pseudoustus TaxID=1810923 RepID=A0ABR4JSC5_9EURO